MAKPLVPSRPLVTRKTGWICIVWFQSVRVRRMQTKVCGVCVKEHAEAGIGSPR